MTEWKPDIKSPYAAWNDQEKYVMRMLYENTGMTQADIAKELGVSQSRVAEIKATAIKKARKIKPEEFCSDLG
jgi:DNA-directed RNA polymerase specialized sigma subunit